MKKDCLQMLPYSWRGYGLTRYKRLCKGNGNYCSGFQGFPEDLGSGFSTYFWPSRSFAVNEDPMKLRISGSRIPG